jgi:hypothetical protein
MSDDSLFNYTQNCIGTDRVINEYCFQIFYSILFFVWRMASSCYLPEYIKTLKTKKLKRIANETNAQLHYLHLHLLPPITSLKNVILSLYNKTDFKN